MTREIQTAAAEGSRDYAVRKTERLGSQPEAVRMAFRAGETTVFADLRTGRSDLWQVRDSLSRGVSRVQTQLAYLDRASSIVERIAELGQQANAPGLSDADRQGLEQKFRGLLEELATIAGQQWEGEPLFGGRALPLMLDGESPARVWEAPALDESLYGNLRVAGMTDPAGRHAILHEAQRALEVLGRDRARLQDALAQFASAAERVAVREANRSAAVVGISAAEDAAEAVAFLKNRILVRGHEILQAQTNPSAENVLRLLA
ncbi:MAG: hypothetical protein NZM03_10995 [Limisphaera sp.]|nr:hypothetical protein [Limisphaera sp.]